jgi:hypothetical protein
MAAYSKRRNMPDPNELLKTIDKVSIPDVAITPEGEELTEAEQSRVSGGGGYGGDNSEGA